MPFLTSILSAVFPALFLYCNNAEEAAFSEIFGILMLFAAIGIVTVFVGMFFARSWNKAAIIAVILNIVLLNYALLEDAIHIILPNAKYWHIVPVLIYLLVIIGFAIKHYLNDDLADSITFVLSIVFTGLTVINVLTSIPGVMSRISAEKQLEQSQVQESNVADTEYMPNIYLMIFDEYAGFKQISEYYNYDNAILKDFLEENNFSISYTSKNESISTATILANLVNIDYVAENQMSSSEKEFLRKQGTLFNLLKERGYMIQGLEAPGFFGLPSPLNNDTQSQATLTAGGKTMKDLCLLQTMIYPFYPQENESIGDILSVVHFLSSKDMLPEGNTFTLVYLNIPHEPFLVDENGNPRTSSGWHNWEDDRYYLGQYKYATKLMIQMITNILENDSDSIIILQSDHGARASTSDAFMEKFPLEVMQNPLNAVYFRGDNVEIEGLSAVNTMRTVLNYLFNENYSMLDVPIDTYKYK